MKFIFAFRLKEFLVILNGFKKSDLYHLCIVNHGLLIHFILFKAKYGFLSILILILYDFVLRDL